MSGIIAQNTLDNSGLIKAPAGGGAWNFISKQTASADATIDFTSGIDSTYKEYVFTFIDIHPSGDLTDLQVNFRDGSTAYDAIKTTAVFRTYAGEADDEAILGYNASWDLAQSTGVQLISHGIDNDNDSCAVATLHLFNPSSTTFVKHFMSVSNAMNGTYTHQNFVAGYCNVTAAIDGVQFSMSSGTIDSGQISLYGISS